MLSPSSSLLNNSYKLLKKLSENSEREVWAASDRLGNDVLVKTWGFSGSQLDQVQRQLWDVEQRNLYRLSSSPGADKQLLILKEAGVHWNEKGGGGYFVMALQSPGFDRLIDLLDRRSECHWLKEIENIEVRVPVWQSIRDLACALIRIHELQMLHRGISAKNIFLSRSLGPSSMRLGGFEWTVRIGDSQNAKSSMREELFPPEFDNEVEPFSVETDWFMFGALIARILCSATADASLSLKEQYEHVYAAIQSQLFLTDIEKQLLEGLLSPTPGTRLSSKHEILSQIDEIIAKLDNPAVSQGQYLGLVVQLGPQQRLTEKVIDEDSSILASDIEAQRRFIENDLSQPSLHNFVKGDDEQYIIAGKRLCYFISEHRDVVRPSTGKWDLAFCHSPAEIRYSTEAEQKKIVDISVSIFTQKTYRDNPDVVLKSSLSWSRFLPTQEKIESVSDRVSHFHDFFRITNQIELLMRDAEIFSYRVLERRKNADGEVLTITEHDPREILGDFLQRQELAGFLNREWQEKGDGDRVQLSGDEEIRTRSNIDESEYWKITDINTAEKTVKLKRGIAGKMAPAPDVGYLRCFGMFGGLKVIQRRLHAINSLQFHTFLLQAMLDPGLMYMHSDVSTLPQRLDPSLDDAKQKTIRNIWSTKPMFVVQGPPGTGKTTLVANFLKQIFAEDNVAQVLVSAQAHSAVDVLRKSVSDVFDDLDSSKKPLAVRIPRSRSDQFGDPSYPASVTLGLLQNCESKLKDESDRNDIQCEWLENVEAAIQILKRNDTEAISSDFVQLVMRSANITYCSTTSAKLLQLADSSQTFDWSIIEEAGKAHGFELALPLQNGHRWLLIGDHQQLPPYRYKDFLNALQSVDELINALERLQEKGDDLVDRGLIRKWHREYDSATKDRCRNMWINWLPVFDRLFQTCNERTGRDQNLGLWSTLTQQHRMHPTIANLVSEAFYDGKIQSMTEKDGLPMEKVVHPFAMPEAVCGAAIVWLDVAAVTEGGVAEQRHNGPYTSQTEVDAIVNFANSLQAEPIFSGKLDMAVLSPYRLQVFQLADAVKERIYKNRPKWLSDIKQGERFANTVDSFQGNQADIVVVSLVRNNNHETKRESLGFLEDSGRLNVLFSRAEKLLVLVGSWTFFESQLNDVAPDAKQPLGNLRLAFDYLSKKFESGEAVKIDAKEIVRGAAKA